eukprot:16430129-Heterocapsa_arctica.AAC.1
MRRREGHRVIDLDPDQEDEAITMDITEEGPDSRKRQRPDPESIQEDDSVPMDISEGGDQEEGTPDHEDDRPGVIQGTQMEGEGSANPASEADSDT